MVPVLEQMSVPDMIAVAAYAASLDPAGAEGTARR